MPLPPRPTIALNPKGRKISYPAPPPPTEPVLVRHGNPRPQKRWGRWWGRDEIALLQDLCREDFWTFFLYAYGAGLNPKGDRWIEPRVHQPMAAWFQFHVDEWLHDRSLGVGKHRHLAVLVHREVGKTTMITRAGSAWLQLRDPEISVYIGGENTKLAKKSLRAIKSAMDGSDRYALWPRLYGNWASSARHWTGEEVVHAARRNTARAEPSFGIFGVETSITGAHPDVIIRDDPVSYEAMQTDADWLQAVNSQGSSLIPILQADGLMIEVGTRYDDLDQYGIAFRDEGIASLSGFPCDSLKPEKGGLWHVYYMAGRDRDGQPTTPKVWPEERLFRFQKRNPTRYAAQVLNDPSLSETNPLTTEQIRQSVIPAKEVPWAALRFAICCDTALWDGRKIGNKDETVFLVHGYPRNGSGDVYVVEGQGSATWRAEDLAKHLVMTVQRYRRQGRRVFAITDEDPKAGKRGTWKTLLQNFFHDAGEPMPPLYEFNRPNTQNKYARLSTAATFWADGHVRVVDGAPGVQRLMEQMAKIGQYAVNEKIKVDWADAHADAFQPQLYQAMRRAGPERAPWERGAEALDTPGLDQKLFEEDEAREWEANCPRPPLR